MLPPLDHIPREIASLGDYEAAARQRIDPAAWAYLNAGAGDEWTMHENVSAFSRLPLRTRVLRSMQGASTATSLFGCTLDSPILIAPTAYHRLAHPDGEQATVLAAGATGTAMVVSTQASLPLEDLAAAAAGPLWFQIYIQPDRDFTSALAERAEAAGYRALVVTVDAPVNGLRNAEARAGFALPPDIRPVNLNGMRMPDQDAAIRALLFGTPVLDHAAIWDDLGQLRARTRLPIIVKGIACPEDATLALQCGVDGIIVSNHGGRVLDGMPASIDLLPAVVEAVNGWVPVLMDGGIRRGNDVVRALALGAQAVLIGRPILHALATAGALGVAHAIRVLRAELELAMALTGCRTLEDIGRHCLHGSSLAQIWPFDRTDDLCLDPER
ncbi:4-hydroxymandelate oxidase [Blastomonas natatoria]|uniref:4-hydroxymandelate oxidase n=1 Tax=Blastomonas natatoria TaxID=34015 RepID=A0A2V3V7B8_9SPHN|nr:alpha-hydroxy acid oxidase [Blastomonas natatoria]PXW77666.1 4-hydroxymandelate oxidase [Blastomonas natatoria]